MVQQQEFLSTYIFGAVCPAQDCGAAIIVPLSNTEGMNMLLQEISKKIPAGRHAFVVVDKASWHRSKALIIPANISLIYLPAYSPELNPSEQCWEYMKQMWLSNCFFENYDVLLQACCDAWNDFVSEAGRIKSLCTRSWAIL